MSNEQAPKIDDEEVLKIVRQYITDSLHVRVSVDSSGIEVKLFLDGEQICYDWDQFVE